MEETGAGVLLAFSDNSSAQERGEKGGCRRSDLTAGRDSRWLLVVSDAARKREEEEGGGGRFRVPGSSLREGDTGLTA